MFNIDLYYSTFHPFFLVCLDNLSRYALHSHTQNKSLLFCKALFHFYRIPLQYDLYFHNKNTKQAYTIVMHIIYVNAMLNRIYNKNLLLVCIKPARFFTRFFICFFLLCFIGGWFTLDLLYSLSYLNIH